MKKSCSCKKIKKAPSAYNLYIKSITKKGETIAEALKNSEWKTMSEAKKEPFIKRSIAMAAEVKKKRVAAGPCTCAKGGVMEKKKRAKRAPSAYNKYMKSKHKKGESFSETLKKYGPMWKKMSDAEKAKFK